MEITRSNRRCSASVPGIPRPIGTSDTPEIGTEHPCSVILRFTIVLCQAFEIWKSTHRDAKLGSNRADYPVRQNPFLLDIARRGEKTRIVFVRRLPASSIPYHRHYLQELGRALEPSRGSFSEQLEENGERLWDTSSCSSGNGAC